MLENVRFSVYRGIVARFMTKGFATHPVIPLAQPLDTTVEHVAHDDLFPHLSLPGVRVPSSFMPTDDAQKRRRLIRTRSTLRGLLVRLAPTTTPPVPTDPQEFLDAVYHPAYRKTWPAPTLPPELAGDPDEIDVIAALAVRGPFGSFLRLASPEDVAAGEAVEGEYVIDLSDHLDHEVHPGLMRPGGKAVLSVTDGVLSTRTVVRPDGVDQRLARRAFVAALNEEMTTYRHNLGLHNVVLTDMCIATTNHLSPRHPIRRVLQHTFHTLLIGNRENVSGQLADPLSFAVTLFSHTAAGVSTLATRRLEAYDFWDLEPGQQFARRGTTQTPFAYPYRDNVLELWRVNLAYVAAYVDLYYPDDAAVRADRALSAWADELDALLPNPLTRPDGGLTRDWVTRVCATVIHLSTVEHDLLNNVIWDYGTFGYLVPTVVPESGEHMDQLRAFDLITTLFLTWRPFNMLFDSHVESMALDGPGRQVMLDWLARLHEVQQAMEARGHDPSLAYPKNFNVSITN
jgi:arachidonate 15-lipoxygenase